MGIWSGWLPGAFLDRWSGQVHAEGDREADLGQAEENLSQFARECLGIPSDELVEVAGLPAEMSATWVWISSWKTGTFTVTEFN